MINYLVAVDSLFVDRPSGLGRVAWDIAQLVRDQGHSVTLLCSQQYGDRYVKRLSEHEGIRVLRYPLPRVHTWSPRRAESHINVVAKVAEQEFGTEQWDVVHMHSLFPGIGVMRSLGKGPRYVYTVHSPAVLEARITWASQGWAGLPKLLFGLKKIERMERDLLSSCDAIHLLSEFTREQVVHFHGLAGKASVIPHWCRLEFQRNHTRAEARGLLGWPQDRPVLFTLRRLVGRMGLDVAINAIAPLAAQGRCVFVLGGDGALRPQLEKQARRLGADNYHVRFTGRLVEEDLLLAYQAADLFVLPTRALECFGLIIQEAMSMGCPVLGTDAGAIPEIVQPISPDFIVPAGEVAPLHEKVKDFLDGRLVPPSDDKLTRYMKENYSELVITPKIMDMVCG